MWSLSTGVSVARKVEAILSPHYHVALGGGVLQKGRSFHDLDLIVYPHKSYRASVSEVRELLEEWEGWELTCSGDTLHKLWRAKGNLDAKWVEVWSYNDRRVDLIYTFPGPA